MSGSFFSVDFGALIRVVWKEKWWILLIAVLITGLGIYYAFSLREEFKTQGQILPELQGSKGSGGLSQIAGLASLAGIDLNSVSGAGIDAVRPDLYPNLLQSTPFFLALLNHKIYTKDNRLQTFQEYYHKVLEEGEAPSEKKIRKSSVKGEGLILLNQLEEERIKDLKLRISADYDKRSGLITISSKMPDPVVAAETAKFAMDYLMEYIVNYRTEKLKSDVEYLANQVDKSKGKYYSTQIKKATYADNHQSATIRLQTADVHRERIESEYKLSSTFYNEILKKYEEAKYRLHQETPVFKVLEPPIVPATKLEPKRKSIGIMSMILGGFVSILFSVFKSKNYRVVFVKK